MRIALCTEIFDPSFGGVEKRVYETTKRMEKKGIKIDVYTTSKPTAESHRFSIKQVSPFTVTKPPKRSFLLSLRYWFVLIKELRHEEFNIIDANGHLSLIPCSIIGKITKKPVIATIHDLYLKDWKYMTFGVSKFLGYLLESLMCILPYTKIITVNTSLKKQLHKKFKIPKKNILIVPNGITVKEIDSIKAGKRKEKTVLFVGRLVPQKNVDLLLRAFAQAYKKIPDLNLEIIGDGAEKKRLQELTKKLGINKSTSFSGHKKNKEVLKRLKQATMLVIPSKRESFGITILEAMICYTPVISTSTEGPIDYIKSGTNGFLTGLNDYKDIAKKIVLLANKKNLRKRIANNARRTAEEYDWDKITDKLINIFRKTMDTHRRIKI